ncbi:MAG TPA: tetratricopeptide repeat protein [Candidatus Saccharimonadaceae bacterium]|nr:tetratricopeptide repeat protein [Candidatus Saccharimonadaceae bacterium]
MTPRSDRVATLDRPVERPRLLGAKLNRPETGDRHLERPRLLQALTQHAARPLTLVVADAGFGKTSLLADFAKRRLQPVVWYSLMPSDADVVVFGRYLMEGFRRDAPRFGRDFARALEETRPGARSAEMLAGTLVNELAALRGPTRLLVLDDFQEVGAHRGVLTFTDTLLRYLPPTVRVVIAARTAPPLALERLRAAGHLFELHSSHLRLTRDEMARLFAEVYRRPLAEPELTALEETTLGWPTAVHLVHEALRRDGDARLEDILADVRSSNLQMHEYLSSEVYSRLDEDTRRLLDATSTLQRFDAPLAARLSGVARPQRILTSLARRGLLRAFGEGDALSYECHDLVRRFVVQELESAGGAARLRGLETACAEALEERGEHERALRHWLRAGHHHESVRLVRDLAPQLLREGRAAALLDFIGGLPAGPASNDLELALALADARQALGNWDDAEAQYQDVLERCRSQARRDVELRALLGLGKVLNLRGRHEQVLGMAERGLAMSARLPRDLRARLLQMKAGAHFYLGQYHAAVDVLGQVRALLADAPEPELLLPTIHNLAGAYAALGKFREASDEFRVALAQVRGTSSPRAPLYLSNLAFHLAELGELAEARRAAEEGLAAAQRFSNRAMECVCHQALAQVQAQAGDLDGALAALRQAEALNAELRMEVIETDLLLLHGRVFLARGQYRRAVEFVSRAIERLAVRPDDPRLCDARAVLAWCELRAGRLHVARTLLESLWAPADATENDYLRMRVHYWLAETLLALGERRHVAAHAALALRLVRERDYLYFLKVQVREDHGLALHALEHGIEPDLVASALVEAQPDVETALLSLLAGASAPVGETAIAVLAEVGGHASGVALGGLAARRGPLQPAARRALAHLERRSTRGAAAQSDGTPAAARLVLHGPARLEVGGRPLPASAWRTQRAFQMLVYLALHPRGATRDVLLERFWPGRQAAAGRRNLHPTLSYVRSVLPRAEAAPILREGERYFLNPAYPMTCDAWDVDHALDAARRAEDDHARRAALERAIAQSGGLFLEGFYEDWADELQARERDRTCKVLLELGALCAGAGDFEPALAHFRRALERDPYREGTCLAVMECEVRLGNQRAAMVEYERLKTLLRGEVGVEPLPETEESVRELLRGASVHGWPEAGGREPAHGVGRQTVATSAQARLKRSARGSS